MAISPTLSLVHTANFVQSLPLARHWARPYCLMFSNLHNVPTRLVLLLSPCEMRTLRCREFKKQPQVTEL